MVGTKKGLRYILRMYGSPKFKIKAETEGHSMQVYHGKSVFGGIAIGKISVFSKKEHKIVPER